MNTLWPGCGGLSIIEPLPHTHTHIPPVPCVSSQLPPDPLDGLHTLHPFWGPGPRPRLLLPQALGMAQILPQPRTSLCTSRDIPPPCTHYLVPPPHTQTYSCAALTACIAQRYVFLLGTIPAPTPIPGWEMPTKNIEHAKWTRVVLLQPGVNTLPVKLVGA